MAKRDYFEEIRQIRERNPQRKGCFDDLLRRLEPLSNVTKELAKRKRLTAAHRELLRYAPVGAIACVEGYYKSLIRELVDFGPRFRDNIVDMKGIKLSLDCLVNLHIGKATLGEFVSHFVSISSINDIDNYMSAVLGIEFLKLLKQNTSFQEDVIPGVSRAFDLRHIITHELAPNVRPTPQEAMDYVMWAFILIITTEFLLKDLLKSSESNA